MAQKNCLGGIVTYGMCARDMYIVHALPPRVMRLSVVVYLTSFIVSMPKSVKKAKRPMMMPMHMASAHFQKSAKW